EANLQVALDLRRVRASTRAARADAARDAGHQLLAVEKVDVAGVEARRSAARVGPLDRAEPAERPANAGEAVAALGAVAEREPRLEAMEGWDLDGNRLAEAPVERADLLARLLDGFRAARHQQCKQDDSRKKEKAPPAAQDEPCPRHRRRLLAVM